MSDIGSGGGSGESDLIVYPLDHMREVAARLLSQASYAQAQHDSAWSQFQVYVSQDCAPDLQETMMNCVQPYGERLRTSYDWLISLAGALFQAIDAIEQAEGQTSQAFDPTPGRHPN